VYPEKTTDLLQVTDNLSHNVESSTSHHERVRTHNFSGDRPGSGCGSSIVMILYFISHEVQLSPMLSCLFDVICLLKKSVMSSDRKKKYMRHTKCKCPQYVFLSRLFYFYHLVRVVLHD
jgi:hypothetical protein